MYELHLRSINPKTKIEDWLRGHADLLWDSYKSGDQRITVELSNYHPELIGASNEAIMAHQIKYHEIENVILEQYSFMTWMDIKEAGKFDIEFERAVNAVLAGDTLRVAEMINAKPELVNQKSQFGHQANLIQYLGANGIEIWRQMIPAEVVDMLELLIEQGADPDAPNNIYGGSNLRTLIETSEHTLLSGLSDAMLEKLEEYGY